MALGRLDGLKGGKARAAKPAENVNMLDRPVSGLGLTGVGCVAPTRPANSSRHSVRDDGSLGDGGSAAGLLTGKPRIGLMFDLALWVKRDVLHPPLL